MKTTAHLPKLLSLFLFVSFTIISCNETNQVPVAPQAPAFDMNTAKAAIEAANRKFEENAINNPAALTTFYYTSDAILLPPNSEPVTGADNIVTFMGGFKQTGVKAVKLNMKDVAGGECGIAETGAYEISDSTGTVVDKGKTLVFWQQVNGEWRAIRDIWNTSMPMPVAN